MSDWESVFFDVFGARPAPPVEPPRTNGKHSRNGDLKQPAQLKRTLKYLKIGESVVIGGVRVMLKKPKSHSCKRGAVLMIDAPAAMPVTKDSQ